MANKVNWIISDGTITISFDGKSHMIPRTDAYADKLIDALKNKRFDEVPDLISAAERIAKFSKGKFKVEDGEILIDGVACAPVLGKKIKEFADQGLPYEPLVAFARNLAKNPSTRSVNELYQFLEKNNHPITENGNFIAYKKVRTDFKDIHTGTFDNSPGQILKMPRTQVNDDPNVYCSNGFHCSDFSYATNFSSGIMLELEVNPEHVVSVPLDYEGKKMRVCEYKVLKVIEEEHKNLSLRITNENSEEAFTCEECGNELEDDSSFLCIDCEDNCGEVCAECGESAEDLYEDDLCESCFDSKIEDDCDCEDCVNTDED